MEKLYININFGISIFLKYNYIFEYLLNNNIFSEIYVSIDKNTFNYYRNTYPDSFYDEYYDILKLIITNDKIKILYNEKYKLIGVNELLQNYNITIKYNILNHLISNEKYIEDNYITITTKIFNTIKYDDYILIKDKFFDKLNKSKYKIVLLGEREITSSNEYKLYDNYSIYNDCIANLNNKLDYTVDSSISNNNINLLKKSFNILHHSKLNIYFSTSGISIITLFTSNNILGLILPVLVNYYNTNDFLHENKNISICDNINILLDKLYSFLDNN